MNNTFPTEGNLSGLSRKDFQKDINDKKTRKDIKRLIEDHKPLEKEPAESV